MIVNPTIEEMIDTAIHNYIRIKAKRPTLLVLNRLAYLTLLAFCVDLRDKQLSIKEDGTKIEVVADLYKYLDMDIAVLQAPTVPRDGKYKVKVMVH